MIGGCLPGGVDPHVLPACGGLVVGGKAEAGGVIG